MLNEILDVKTLSERTGLPVRQIRYILDHDLMPERTWMADEHAVGRARTFGAISGVLIAVAGFLLQAGYRREGVRELIVAVCQPRRSKRNSLNLPIIGDFVVYGGTGQVQFADGRYVRWIINQKADGWIDSKSSSEIPENWVPKVIVEINISAIRDQVYGETTIS